MANLTLEQTSAERRISRARHALVMSQPFFGCLALHLTVEPWPADLLPGQTQTMATDGKRLLYGAAFVNALPEPELIGLIAHEVLHIAYLHHTRRGGRDPSLWNEAADCAINRDLISQGFKLPAGGLNVGPRDQYPGLNAEQIYARMQKEGRKPTPGLPGGILDAAPVHEPAKLAEAEQETQIMVRQAVMVAKSSQSGPGASAMLQGLFGELSAPKVSWRDVLRRFADESSHRDYSWTRPNRRHLHAGLILPGAVSIAPCHIVCAVDTSGSMSRAALRACISEVQAMLDEGAADRVTVVYCDSAVKGSETFEAGDLVKANPVGGGGTRFAPVWAWVEANAPDCAAVLYLTDMGSSDWGSPPEMPVLWVRYGSTETAPFGEHVDVDLAD